ncbi:MAG TPA: MarR family transcriptional regulator [Gryllotalpicola sp.]
MTAADRTRSDVATRIRMTAGSLTRRLRGEASGVTGLTWSQESIVALLSRAPAGMSTAELARAEGVRGQTMSAAVAVLEQAGFLRGEPDPSDGRRTVLHVTDTGLAALTEARAVKQKWLEELLQDFTADEIDALVAGMDLLNRIAGS